MRKRKILVGTLLAAMVVGGVVGGGGAANAQAQRLDACPLMPSQAPVSLTPGQSTVLGSLRLIGESDFSPLLLQCTYSATERTFQNGGGLIGQTPRVVNLLCGDDFIEGTTQRCGTIDAATITLMDRGVLNRLP